MRTSRQICGLLSVISCAWLAGCGAPGAPVPPALELPRPPSDLRASRKADRVVLTWTIPTQTTEQRTVRHEGPTLVCRSLDPSFSQCGQPVAEIPASQLMALKSSQPKGMPVHADYTDMLPKVLEEEHPTATVTYAVSVLNPHRRSAGMSNRVQVPLAPTLEPPGNFHAEVTESGVVLSWIPIPPPAEIAGLQYFYRVYRAQAASQNKANTEVVVGQLPLGATPAQIVDHSFDWEQTYSYRATVVTTLAPAGLPVMQVEGEDTPAIEVFAHDVFPPAVPSGMEAVASGAGQPPFIDLIWAPVTAPDLAGYNVYRREQNSEWMKVNPALVQTPAYRDTSVVPGQTYFYSVSAVDLRGNESARSPQATETIPTLNGPSSR